MVLLLGTIMFVVLGGALLVPGLTAGGLPTGESVRAVLHGATDGWARLLTVVPPAGQEGDLLAVPCLAAAAAAAAATALALVRPWAALPATAPLAALVVAILWGTGEPAALWAQGLGFGALAAIWMATRASRNIRRPQALGGRRAHVGAPLVLAGALGLSVVLAGALPGLADERYVLRDHTDPPLDPSAFASPLARFPQLFDPSHGDPAGGPVLLRVASPQRIPAKTTLRLATMDAYDGSTFLVRGSSAGSTNVFVKVSTSLPGGPGGATVQLDVTTEALGDVWLPVVGRPVALQPTGDASRAASVAQALRYNGPTRALILPGGLQKGDRYRLTTVLDEVDDVSRARAATSPADAAALGDPLPDIVPPSYAALAGRLTKDAKTPFAQADAIAAALKERGRLAEDDPGGHSLLRLAGFLGRLPKDGGAVIHGTPEQFAATMAILARTIGLPRVLSWDSSCRRTLARPRWRSVPQRFAPGPRSRSRVLAGSGSTRRRTSPTNPRTRR